MIREHHPQWIDVDQEAMDSPLAQPYSNQEVFKAAVNALGSNSRNWASFVKVRDQ